VPQVAHPDARNPGPVPDGLRPPLPLRGSLAPRQFDQRGEVVGDLLVHHGVPERPAERGVSRSDGTGEYFLPVPLIA
jgi:hypothetical protein